MLTQHQETWFDDAIQQGWEKGWKEGWEKGREEGREETLRRVVHNLLQQGMAPEKIEEVTGLPLDKIRSMH